jgi:heme-degrading monooxygenase HmoA
MSSTSPVARVWRCITRADAAGAYVEHLHSATFPKLRQIPGHRGAWLMRRVVPRGVEFLVVTTWDSMEAVERFAGPEPEVAVVPPEARALMVEYDERVQHFEVIDEPGFAATGVLRPG